MTSVFEPRLTGKTVVMFIDFSFEDMEVMFPKMRLEEEGAQVIVAGSHAAGKVQRITVSRAQA